MSKNKGLTVTDGAIGCPNCGGHRIKIDSCCTGPDADGGRGAFIDLTCSRGCYEGTPFRIRFTSAAGMVGISVETVQCERPAPAEDPYDKRIAELEKVIVDVRAAKGKAADAVAATPKEEPAKEDLSVLLGNLMGVLDQIEALGEKRHDTGK